MFPRKASNYRCKLLAVVIPAVIIITGLALGLGIGLTRHKNTSSDASSPPPTPSTNTTIPANSTWWSPAVGATWQIVLQYPLNNTARTNISIYDIDLFTNPPSTLSLLHSQNQKVICYFSAGSYEDFRPDSGSFVKSDYGKPLDGWPGEWWLDTNSENVRSIMLARMEMALSKGCDGVDPDNIDGYSNDNGLGLTQDDAVDYVTFLAGAAHARNLSIGLKNGGDIVPRVLDLMEWEVNEQCVQYDECDVFRSFISEGKPVFHIEYPSSAPEITAAKEAKICGDPTAAGFSTLLKNMDLNDWVEAC